MPKAVLTTRVDPSYDDLPEDRYHFPRTYLNTIEGALNDWIVYYEPRRSGHNLSSSGGRQLCIPVKLDTDSGPNWTPIPAQTGQSSARSDAGSSL